jgi:hypothetical protein
MNVLRCLKINDKQTVEEFKTYIRQDNGVWKKQDERYLDDRVEALIWAIFILDTKVVEQFFEVSQKDNNGKPLKIVPTNWDPFIVSMPKPSELYNKFNKDKNVELPFSPVFIPTKENEVEELEELKARGWEQPNYSTATRMLPNIGSPGYLKY